MVVLLLLLVLLSVAVAVSASVASSVKGVVVLMAVYFAARHRLRDGPPRTYSWYVFYRTNVLPPYLQKQDLPGSARLFKWNGFGTQAKSVPSV